VQSLEVPLLPPGLAGKERFIAFGILLPEPRLCYFLPYRRTCYYSPEGPVPSRPFSYLRSATAALVLPSATVAFSSSLTSASTEVSLSAT
jgi:hypothetical protein